MRSGSLGSRGCHYFGPPTGHFPHWFVAIAACAGLAVLVDRFIKEEGGAIPPKGNETVGKMLAEATANVISSTTHAQIARRKLAVQAARLKKAVDELHEQPTPERREQVRVVGGDGGRTARPCTARSSTTSNAGRVARGGGTLHAVGRLAGYRAREGARRPRRRVAASGGSM